MQYTQKTQCVHSGGFPDVATGGIDSPIFLNGIVLDALSSYPNRVGR